jgi:hypothetical protein
VLGVLGRDLEAMRAAAEAFAAPLEGIALWGDPLPFDQTTYYEAELGAGLTRFYCAAARLVPPETLPDLKRAAWDLEQQLGAGRRRTVNLDPGYLDASKVVLASFKAGPQKLHLGGGVWADPVLHYGDGAWRPLPWTFPDLKGSEHHGFFAGARRAYLARLRMRGRS